MYFTEANDEELSVLAMLFFEKAGMTVASEPLFINHTLERVVYFDTDRDIVLNQAQRSILHSDSPVTYLFDIKSEIFSSPDSEAISFYAIDLKVQRKERSQCAYDIHNVLRKAFSGAGSVILFRNEGEVMLTVQGYDSDVILSDWYSVNEKIEELSEKIHSCNMRYHSSREFLEDFVYAAARWYYINPISVTEATYSMFPPYYFIDTPIDENWNFREDLKTMVQNNLNTAEREYGDDYIELQNEKVVSTDIGKQLDLLALEMDLDEETEYEENEYNSFIELRGESVGGKEIADLEAANPSIFADPQLLVKYLKKQDVKAD